MIRAGIPYGREVSLRCILAHFGFPNRSTTAPKVTDEESRTQVTSEDRGLLFVSYQNLLDATGTGFSFIQQRWANFPGFPFPEKDAPPHLSPPG